MESFELGRILKNNLKHFNESEGRTNLELNMFHLSRDRIIYGWIEEGQQRSLIPYLLKCNLLICIVRKNTYIW
jgi:hypothetical protein